mmetsp:Transcript_12775/g.32657  ORF Transcript_12775/g.32657 Transcript_12775/m.32657 type:complete len:626 (-) Transcript_12775:147-2024(-)
MAAEQPPARVEPNAAAAPAPPADGDADGGAIAATDDCVATFARALAAAAAHEASEVIEAEPYKHKYAARRELEAARDKLSAEIASGVLAESAAAARHLVARLDCRVGINLYLTEENTDGEKRMLQGAKVLEGGEEKWPAVVAALEQGGKNGARRAALAGLPAPEQLDSDGATDLINVYNYLGILWSHRASGNDKAAGYLERARALYELWALSSAESEEREQVHTETLFFLAQVYAATGESAVAAELCTETLGRQRKLGHSFEPIRWARDALGLAALFGVNQGATRVASHLICAALRAIAEIDHPGGVGDGASDDEAIAQIRADALRAKGALYLAVLEHATDLHVRHQSMHGRWAERELQLALPQSDTVDEQDELDECPPAVQDAAGFDAARQLFKVANTAFEEAKAFFVLDGYTTDHVTILRSQSQLYRLLALQEQDPKRISAMHSRRDNLLSGLLDQLNTEFYTVEHQELAYELGEASREILTANTNRLKGREVARGDVKRIATAAMKTVRYYMHFIKMYEVAEKKDKQSGQETATPEEQLPYLYSHFWIAHALHHMVPNDPKSADAQVKALVESHKAFLRTLEVSKQRLPAEKADLFATEKQICEDMVELLPAQIAQLQRQIG